MKIRQEVGAHKGPEEPAVFSHQVQGVWAYHKELAVQCTFWVFSIAWLRQAHVYSAIT